MIDEVGRRTRCLPSLLGMPFETHAPGATEAARARVTSPAAREQNQEEKPETNKATYGLVDVFYIKKTPKKKGKKKRRARADSADERELPRAVWANNKSWAGRPGRKRGKGKAF